MVVVSECTDGWTSSCARSGAVIGLIKSDEMELFCGDCLIKILLLTLTRLAHYLFYSIGKGRAPNTNIYRPTILKGHFVGID